jgi:hypothetical protein
MGRLPDPHARPGLSDGVVTSAWLDPVGESATSCVGEIYRPHRGEPTGLTRLASNCVRSRAGRQWPNSPPGKVHRVM